MLVFLELCVATQAGVLLAIIAVRSAGFWIKAGMRPLEAIEQAVSQLADVVVTCGVLGWVLIVGNHVLSFGFLIALSIISLRWLPLRRVLPWYIFSAVALLIFALITPTMAGMTVFDSVPVNFRQMSPAGVPLAHHWSMYILRYPVYAIPASMAVGAIVAMLPMFGPSQRSSLRRGVCPKCQYNLKEETDQGCPECGWNRQGTTAGREVALIPKRGAIRRRAALLLVGWTLLVLLALGIGGSRYAVALPSVMEITREGTLKNPRSGAYSDVLVRCTTRLRSGWFGGPYQAELIEWSATFRHNKQPEFHELSSSASHDEMMAAIAGDFETLAEIVVDPMIGAAVFRASDAELRVPKMLDVAQFSRWLARTFPRAHEPFFEEEAEAILHIIDQWAKGTVPTGNLSMMPVMPKGSQAFRSKGGRRSGDWPSPRPEPAAVVIVLGGFVAIWFAGVVAIHQWMRRALRDLHASVPSASIENVSSAR